MNSIRTPVNDLIAAKVFVRHMKIWQKKSITKHVNDLIAAKVTVGKIKNWQKKSIRKPVNDPTYCCKNLRQKILNWAKKIDWDARK